MAPIRRIGRALIVASALSLPGLALAEQPAEMCDGDKMEEGKEPTAEKSEPKQNGDKAKKTDDKSDQKRNAKEAQKPDSV